MSQNDTDIHLRVSTEEYGASDVGSGCPRSGFRFFITTKKATNMKTKFNNLMFSRFHLSEIEHLPSKKYKAIVNGVLHHFYDDQEPDFSKFTDGDKLTKIYAKMVTYIDNGIQKADSKNIG